MGYRANSFALIWCQDVSNDCSECRRLDGVRVTFRVVLLPPPPPDIGSALLSQENLGRDRFASHRSGLYNAETLEILVAIRAIWWPFAVPDRAFVSSGAQFGLPAPSPHSILSD